MVDTPQPRNSRYVTVLFLAVFVAVLLLLLRLLAVYLAAFVLAAVLVTLFQPVFSRLLARVGGRRPLAAGLTCTLVVLVVAVPLGLFLVSLTSEVLDLYALVSSGDQPVVDMLVASVDPQGTLAVTVQEWGERVGLDLTPASVRGHAVEAGATLARFLYEKARGFASNTFATLLHFALMVIVMLALFSDGPRLKAYLLDLSPLPAEQEEKLVARFAGISRAVFLGSGVASLAQGICGGLGFYFFGVGSGILWGAAIAFFAPLPIVGATIIFVPAAVLLAVQGHSGAAVAFIIYNLAYTAVLEYGLKPRLIGAESRMSGVLVFLGVLAGLSVFGLLGLFYGPLILTLFLTLAEIYKDDYRSDLMALRSPWARADAAPEVSSPGRGSEPQAPPGTPGAPGRSDQPGPP